MSDQQTWKVGQLASASGITIRMLHHWDAIGLLSPCRRGSGEHREYTASDVERLYLIVTLRGFGLDLSSIKACLDASIDPRRVIEDHLQQLDESLAALKRARDGLAHLAQGLPPEASPSPAVAADNARGPGEVLLNVLRETAVAYPQVGAVVSEQLEESHISDLVERVRVAGPAASYLMGVEWPHLYRQVEGLRQTGAAPNDPRVLPLVRRMEELSAMFNGGDAATAHTVREAWRSTGGWDDLAAFVDAARAVLDRDQKREVEK